MNQWGGIAFEGLKTRRRAIDIVDQETRSRMMSGIRGKDTKPELLLRKALHARGMRYRLQARQLPGRPDLMFRQFQAAVFVHGCFWHRHEGCRYATTPLTRPAFWQAKFASNVERDRVAIDRLRQLDWRVAIVWECALRRLDDARLVVELLNAWFRGDNPYFEIGASHLAKGLPSDRHVNE